MKQINYVSLIFRHGFELLEGNIHDQTLQQKVVLYTKWFHKIFNEFACQVVNIHKLKNNEFIGLVNGD